MLRTKYSSGTTAGTATTADTIIVPAERFTQKRGIVSLLIVTTTLQFQHLTQIVVKVGDTEVFNMTPAQFRLYMQRFMPEKSASAYPADTATSWEIPFYALEFDEGDPRRYLQQLEPGDIQLELTKNNTPGASTVQVGWRFDEDVKPQAYFRVSRRAIGIAASATLDEKFFRGSGFLKFWILNTTGLTEARVYGDVSADPSKEQFETIFWASGTMLAENQRLEDGSAATNPICQRVLDPFVRARMQLQLTTAGGWGGAANELVMGHLIPVAA